MSLVKGTAASTYMEEYFFTVHSFFFFSDSRYALEVQWLTCTVGIVMYFHVSRLIFASVIQVDISKLSSWLWNICTLFSICMETQRFFLYLYCFFLFCFVFSMKSEWNQSCTESISYIQVSSSIIKDQIEVLSVLVSQPTLEGHLVAENGEAWPCSEAFSGCYCHHNGD